MSEMTIVSVALIGVLVISFLIGLARGLKKSIIRGSMVLFSAVLSLFLSPVIVSSLVSKYISGFVISAFGFSLDLEEVAEQLIGDGSVVADMFAVDGTTTKLAGALLNVVMNVVVFVVLFLSLLILTLIVYWIIAIVMSAKGKKNENRKKQSAGSRLGGAVLGMVGSLIICCALFSPVFGVISVCDEFLAVSGTTSGAVAVHAESNAYYNDGKDEKESNDYIVKYSELSEEYKNSFAGKVFKFTGVDFLGRSSFSYLTNVTYNGFELNVVKEVSTFIDVYSKYNDTFVDHEFNVENNQDVEKLKTIYQTAMKSSILKSYVPELLPNFCQHWTNGEAYFGVEFPVSGDYRDIALSLVETFNTRNLNSINENIETLFNAIEILNDKQVIKNINEGQDVKDIISGENTIIKDVVYELSTSQRFKQTLPKFFNNVLKLAYKETIGDPGTKFDELGATPNTIEWEKESTILQKIVSRLFDISLNVNEDSTSMIDQLTNVGVLIDNARNSKLVSNQMELFIKDFVKSEKFNLNENIQNTIVNAVETNWNIVENPNYKFETLFATVQSTAQVAQNITTSDGQINLSAISSALETLLEEDSAAVKTTIENILTSDIMVDLLGEDTQNKENAEIFTNMLVSFLDSTNKTSLENDIAAGQAIVDIVSNSRNGGELNFDLYAKDGEETGTATDLVELVMSSNAIMNMIDSLTTDNEGNHMTESTMQTVTQNINSEDLEAIKGALTDLQEDADEETLQKLDILNRLFGNS